MPDKQNKNPIYSVNADDIFRNIAEEVVVFAIDANLSVIYMSKAIEKYCEKAYNEYINTPLSDIFLFTQEGNVEMLTNGEEHRLMVRLKDTAYYAQLLIKPISNNQFSGIVSEIHQETDSVIAKSSITEIKRILQNMRDVLIVFDANGRYLKILPENPEFEYKPVNEMLGKTVNEILPQNLASLFQLKISEAINSGKAVDFEYQLDTGINKIWYNSRITRIDASTVLFVGRNISRLKKNELEVRKSERELRAILENSLQYFIAFLPNHKVVVYNQSACQLLGEYFDVIPEKSEVFDCLFNNHTLYRRAFNKALQGDKYDFEMQLSNNGKSEWFQFFTSPYYNEQNKVAGVFLNIVNIEQRKRQELQIRNQNQKIKENERNLKITIEELNMNKEELEASAEELQATNDELVSINQQLEENEQRFSSFVNNSTDGVFISDRFGDVAIWNKAIEQLSGMSFERVYGKSLWEVYNRLTSGGEIDEMNFEFEHDDFLYLLKSGDKSISKKINQIVFKDGKVVELIVFPVSLGNKYAIGGIARETTQLNKMQFERDLFYSILNQTDDLATVKDLDCRYLAVNRAFAKLTKHNDTEELKGKTYSEAIGKDHKSVKASDENDKTLINSNREVIVNKFEAKKTGQKVVFLERKFKIRDKNNRFIAIASMSRDITKLADAERKIVEQMYEIQQQKKKLEVNNAEMFAINNMLTASQAKLKSLLNNSPFAICSINRKLVVENFNKEFENYAHRFLSTKIFEGESLSKIYIGGKAGQYIKRIVKAFKGETLEFEDVFEVEEQKSVLHTIYSPVVDDNKEIHSILLIVMDITDRKKAEQELIYEKNLLKTLMDYSIDHIYFKDRQSRFVRNNKSQLNHIHNMGIFDSDNLIGKTDADVFGEEFFEKTFADEQNIIETGVSIIDREEKFIPDNSDEELWFSSTKMPWYNNEGQIIGTFGITRNITVRKQTLAKLHKREAELKEMNATKDKFFSIIAHDLKNPFSTVIQFSELILSTLHKRDFEKIERFVGFINSAANTAFNLLENLLQWSRTQTGRISWLPVETDVDKLIDETIELVISTANNKGIAIEKTGSGSQVVYADKNMFMTVLRNLLSNAIKFTYEGGLIKICKQDVEIDGKRFLKITVEDNGVGMKQEDIKKLFRIDQTITTTGTNEEQGTGLGLILCHEFIKKNVGDIHVESVEGFGSKFSFTTPVKKSEELI